MYLDKIIFNYSYLGLPIPKDSTGVDLKPGSLPDLTNFQIGQSPGAANNSPNSNQVSTSGAGNGNCGTPMENDDQGSPYSSVRKRTKLIKIIFHRKQIIRIYFMINTRTTITFPIIIGAK
jgi:hypothetical protein